MSLNLTTYFRLSVYQFKSQMVYVYYTEIKKDIQQYLFNEYLETLPPILQDNIKRYRQWQDQQAGLLGKLLLRKGLNALNYVGDSLYKIEYTAYKRPMIKDAMDFNISHSGKYVICAIDSTYKIGVDIEKIKPVDISIYKSQMTNHEWNEINIAANKTLAFYDYWTKKEAVIKANGKGLSIPLQSFTIKNSMTTIENSNWYTLPIQIDSDFYCCHLASNYKLLSDDVIITPVTF